MKRFVLLVCAVVFSLGAYAGDAGDLFKNYSNVEGVTYITLSKKTFNLMKPFLGLDKETRRLFDALNLKQMDMFQIGEDSPVDKGRTLEELALLCADSTYVSVRTVSSAVLEENSDFLCKMDGDRIVDFVIYACKDGGLVAMKIACDADVERIMNLIEEKKSNRK